MAGTRLKTMASGGEEAAGKGRHRQKMGRGARVRNAGLKESEKTELILAPTWLVRSSGVCNAPRFNFGRTGT